MSLCVYKYIKLYCVCDIFNKTRRRIPDNRSRVYRSRRQPIFLSPIGTKRVRFQKYREGIITHKRLYSYIYCVRIDLP